MVAREPQLRRRGFFLHSSDGTESDAHEHENPEGFTVRVRTSRRSVPRQMASSGRSRTIPRPEVHDPQIRSGSVTGSRQRAHLPR
jgi:hypothetical protein